MVVSANPARVVLPVACVASVSVLFRSKDGKDRGTEILGFGRARNETRAKR